MPHAHALRVRDFRYLWAAGAAGGLGSSMLVVAIPAHVYAVTGSVLATGVTLAFEHLPSLLLGPVSGVLADRWDRRRLMIATNLVHALAISVVLLARTPETIWLVYVAVLGQGVASVFFRPAARAQIPSVVGTGPTLTSANAVSAVTTGVVGLAGPPLGGLLFATSGVEAVVAAAAAAGLLSATSIARTSPVPATSSGTVRNGPEGGAGVTGSVGAAVRRGCGWCGGRRRRGRCWPPTACTCSPTPP